MKKKSINMIEINKVSVADTFKLIKNNFKSSNNFIIDNKKFSIFILLIFIFIYLAPTILLSIKSDFSEIDIYTVNPIIAMFLFIESISNIILFSLITGIALLMNNNKNPFKILISLKHYLINIFSFLLFCIISWLTVSLVYNLVSYTNQDVLNNFFLNILNEEILNEEELNLIVIFMAPILAILYLGFIFNYVLQFFSIIKKEDFFKSIKNTFYLFWVNKLSLILLNSVFLIFLYIFNYAKFYLEINNLLLISEIIKFYSYIFFSILLFNYLNKSIKNVL